MQIPGDRFIRDFVFLKVLKESYEMIELTRCVVDYPKGMAQKSTCASDNIYIFSYECKAFTFRADSSIR